MHSIVCVAERLLQNGLKVAPQAKGWITNARQAEASSATD